MKWYVSMRAHVVWVLTREPKAMLPEILLCPTENQECLPCVLQCGVANTHIYHGMMILAHTI